MRTLLQLMLGLVVLGLAGGWLLRSRLPRRYVPLALALSFLPLPAHAAFVARWAVSAGIEPLWVIGYGLVCLAIAAAGWWWTRRTAASRPFRAPLGLPVAAFAQMTASQVLGRAGQPLGVVLNPLPGIVLFVVSVAVASMLVVLLPRRDARPLGERGPAWWRALGRVWRR